MYTTAIYSTTFSSPVTGHHYHVHIHIGLCLLAWAVAVVGVCLGLDMASKDKFFGTSQTERVAIFASDVKKLTLKQLKVGGKALIYIKLLAGDPVHILSGGFFMGSGIVVMQYLYILATDIHCTRRWNWDWVVLTAVLSYVLATLLIWVLFRLLTWKPKLEVLRIVSAAGL